MSVVEDLVIILVKKFGYLEKRVTYLEGKCRGQQGTIEKLVKKLRKFRKGNKGQGLITSKVLEDSVDLKPNVESIQISKTNENLTKECFEKCAKNDKKLNQKLIVQMGAKCQRNPLNLNRTIDRKTKNSEIQTEINQLEVKNKEISSKPIKPVKKSHICSFCSKSCTTFSELSRHLRVHTGEQPFKCKICSKSFSLKANLKIHSRKHTGEKPYTCPFCSRAFSDCAGLIRHKMIHTGEKPYSCSFCSKSFSQTGARNDHIRAHIGERPYSCSVCSKTFVQSTALSRHKKIHTCIL